jgi:Protein tyrosine and serine/threonine kinase
VQDPRKFATLWKKLYFVFSILLYSGLGVLYLLLITRATDVYADSLAVIEYAAAFGCVSLPGVMFLVWSYWTCCAMSGFSYKSAAAAARASQINRIALLWSIGRIMRGVVFFIGIEYEWETNLDSTRLSIIVVSTLAISELIPLYFALDWSIIAAIMLGSDNHSFHLPTSESSSRLLSDTNNISVAENTGGHQYGSYGHGHNHGSSSANSTTSTGYHIQVDELKRTGPMTSDDGFEFEQAGRVNDLPVLLRCYRVNSSELIDRRVCEELALEVIRVSSTSYKCVEPFVGVCLIPSEIVIAYELVPGYPLSTLLARTSRPFYSETVLRMLRDICVAMADIHSVSSSRCHGSLTSSSLIVSPDQQLIVTRMGLGPVYSLAQVMLGRRTVNAWSAPELFLGHHISQAADVYSFGIIMWEIMTLQTPFKAMSIDQIRHTVVSDKQRPQIPQRHKMTESYLDLMRVCWSQDMAERPSFEAILKFLDTLEPCNT